MLRRLFRGAEVACEVLADGFRLGDQVFPSLSAAARSVTGGEVNGFAFFGLNQKEVRHA